MDFDDALLPLGKMGTYQWRMFLLICLPACFFSTVGLFEHIFVSALPTHHCVPPQVPEDVESILRTSLSLATEYDEVVKALFLPWNQDERQFDGCLQYSVDVRDAVNLLTSSGADMINASSVKTFVSTLGWPTSSCRQGWIYDSSTYPETLATKFNVVCQQNWLISLAQSVFFVGGAIGTALFGFLGDRYGRRFSFLLGNVVLVTAGIAMIFTPNYETYIVLRFFSGLTYLSIYQLSFVIIVEMIGVSLRAAVAMCLPMVYGLAMVAFGLVAALFPHWRDLQAVSWLPGLLLGGYYWFVPESPRWLVSQGRIDEAEAIVQKMAEVNGKILPKDYLASMMKQNATIPAVTKSSAKDESEVKSPDTSFKMRHLLRYPKVMGRGVLTAFIWLTVSWVYNGTSFEVPAHSSSAYLAFIMSGLVEVPGISMAWFSINRFGRRWTMFGSTFLGGALCLATAFIPKELAWLRETVPTMSKLAISGAFATMYIYAGELFPTVARGFVLGCSATVSSIGLIALPYSLYLGSLYGENVPFIILGASAVLGAMAVLPLRETKGTHLPTTLDEAENAVSFRIVNPKLKKVLNASTRCVMKLTTDPERAEKTGETIVERF